MQHVVFAIFDGRNAAQRAAERVRASLTSSEYDVVFHQTPGLDFENPIHRQKLDIDESDAAPALKRGLVLGATLGAVLGLALALVLALNVWAMLIWGAVGGALLGGLGSVLVGSGLPDRALNRIQPETKHQVLVTFKAKEEEVKDAISDIVRAEGATIAEKAPI
jgi:hypothetical protein